MKALTHATILALLFVFIGGARGMFARWQTQAVPIERILSNLETRLGKDSNNVEIVYALARIHSMASSTNLTTVNVTTNAQGEIDRPVFGYPGSDNGLPQGILQLTNEQAQLVAKRHLTNAITYYTRAAALVASGTNATEHGWLILPIHLGLAWSIEQDGRRDDAIKAYRNALKLAWKEEIDRSISLKEQLEWSWDQIREKSNPLSRPPKYLGPGVCYSEEIIGYLLKILDPKKDAKEIAQLKSDQAKLQAMGRMVTPILVPLESDASFESLVDPKANVTFDLDGSGLPRRWGWITPKAAWLVYDHDGRGQITSALQMFGSVTFWIFWRDGYAALASLDDNGDGKLTGAELKGISLWCDANGNGVADPGEVRPVTEFGILSLDCGHTEHSDGFPFNPRGVVFGDGSVRPTFDWIVPSSPAKQLIE